MRDPDLIARLTKESDDLELAGRMFPQLSDICKERAFNIRFERDGLARREREGRGG